MQNIGFIKRLLVIIYDGLLLAGVTLVAYVPVFGLLQIFPQEIAGSALGFALKTLYLVSVSFCFYGWFWTHGGQTLGMRAWHLYLINPQGKFPNWQTAALRYTVAACSWGLVAGLLYLANMQFWYLAVGLGYSWMLLNPERLTWHDLLSNTRIVHVPPKKGNGLR